MFSHTPRAFNVVDEASLFRFGYDHEGAGSTPEGRLPLRVSINIMEGEVIWTSTREVEFFKDNMLVWLLYVSRSVEELWRMIFSL